MSELTLTLGLDAADSPVTFDLARMPHLLIGGVAGSGKSVCIDSLCAQLEGRVEIRRLDTEAPAAALPALRAAMQELDARLAALKAANVRQISQYHPPMQPIVIVLDEYSHLYIAHQEETEALLVRIAQYGRLAGLHLILSTQRLQPEVLSGLLRANLPSRIAFRTATTEHSRALLDQPGAETLARPGEALFFPIGAQEPIFVRCCAG